MALTLALPMLAQEAEPKLDVLVFRDGDRMSGELDRIEHGAAVFRSFKTGETSVDFSFIQTVTSSRRFALLRKGQPVDKAHVVIGTVELRDETVIVTPAAGPVVTIKDVDVEYAIDDATFEREILHHTNLHEGWNLSASLGGSFVRSTESGGAINGDLTLTRTLPGVDWLPRRNRTEVLMSDSYELLRRTDYYSATTVETESHIFHAGLERNQYFHTRFYGLANYTFDRNYAQGLLAQQLFGVGVGVTILKDYPSQLEIKTDLHRESQGFSDPDNNDVLFGQKITIEYQRYLPGGVSVTQNADYLPAFNLPHRYSANSSTTLAVPLFRHFALSITGTDNYLNNPSPGLKRNAFRLATSLTFTR